MLLVSVQSSFLSRILHCKTKCRTSTYLPQCEIVHLFGDLRRVHEEMMQEIPRIGACHHLFLYPRGSVPPLTDFSLSGKVRETR